MWIWRSPNWKISKATKIERDTEKESTFNEKGNHVSNNEENNSDQKIYASMARMSGNGECTRGNFGDSSQYTNWILDYGAKCHMTPEVSDFIPGSL